MISDLLPIMLPLMVSLYQIFISAALKVYQFTSKGSNCGIEIFASPLIVVGIGHGYYKRKEIASIDCRYFKDTSKCLSCIKGFNTWLQELLPFLNWQQNISLFFQFP